MTRSATTSADLYRPSRAAAPVITVAGSVRAAEWLSLLARELKRPWQVRALREGSVPHGLLVLTRPGPFPESLRHWIAAHQVVVSMDCPQGRSLALSNRVQTFTFSDVRDDADLTARDLRLTQSGQLRFVAVTKTALARVQLDDPDDLYPALAFLACAAWLGAPLEPACKIVAAPRQEQEVSMA